MSRVSEFFESLKEGAAALAPGLDNIGSDIGAEMGRLVKQGAAEIASGLFTGNAFTAYGEGQRHDKGAPENDGADAPKIEPPQIERGGMEM